MKKPLLSEMPKTHVWPWRLGLAGVLLAFAGVALSMVLGNRDAAMGAFWIGFAMTFTGIMWSIFARGESSHDSHPMARVLRVGAVGFAIAMAGVLIGMFTEQDSLSDVIFFLGYGIVVLVVVWAMVVMLGRK